MKIDLIDDGKKGAFKAIENNVQAGLMTFTWASEHKFIIDHTEVDDAFRGKSVGKTMVLAAVDFAREKDLKILPLCPFAKSVFDRMEEINDVRA